MSKQEAEQFSFSDSDEIKRMISDRHHWLDIESLHLEEARKARANIDELTAGIADARALDSIRPYGRTYTSLDLTTPQPSPLNHIFEKVLQARKFLGKRV